jgi:hypothetical protein
LLRDMTAIRHQRAKFWPQRTAGVATDVAMPLHLASASKPPLPLKPAPHRELAEVAAR